MRYISDEFQFTILPEVNFYKLDLENLENSQIALSDDLAFNNNSYDISDIKLLQGKIQAAFN